MATPSGYILVVWVIIYVVWQNSSSVGIKTNATV